MHEAFHILDPLTSSQLQLGIDRHFWEAYTFKMPFMVDMKQSPPGKNRLSFVWKWGVEFIMNCFNNCGKNDQYVEFFLNEIRCYEQIW